MNRPLLLGVDIGTGSSKAVLTDVDGVVVRTAVRAHGTSMPRPGWFEAEGEGMWWTEVVALCRDVLAEVRSDDVAALCVSGVGPALVLTDSDLHPLRPAIVYGIDTRAEQQIDELTARYGDEQILQTCAARSSAPRSPTGCYASPGPGLPGMPLRPRRTPWWSRTYTHASTWSGWVHAAFRH